MRTPRISSTKLRSTVNPWCVIVCTRLIYIVAYSRLHHHIYLVLLKLEFVNAMNYCSFLKRKRSYLTKSHPVNDLYVVQVLYISLVGKFRYEHSQMNQEWQERPQICSNFKWRSQIRILLQVHQPCWTKGTDGLFFIAKSNYNETDQAC